MKKTLIASFASLFFCGFCFAQEAADSTKTRPYAAVVDFNVEKSVKAEITGSAVAVKLEQVLGDNYQLVTRSQVSKSMQELKFQASDLTDKNNAKAFGKMIGADFIITGSVIQIGNIITIAAQCINIETGEIVQTAEASTGDVNQINYLFKEIAHTIVLNAAEKKAYQNDKFDYPKHFDDGKKAFERQEYSEAVSCLKRAIAAKRTPEAEALLKQAEERNNMKLDLQQKKTEYEQAMNDGRQSLKSQDWINAERAFKKALSVPGYANEKEARDGLKNSQGSAESAKKRQEAQDAWALTKTKVKSLMQSLITDANNSSIEDSKRISAADSALELIDNALKSPYISDTEKAEFANFKSQITDSLSELKPSALSGKDFTVKELGMDFVWIEKLECWVGKYEVTNAEYRKFEPLHDSKNFKDGDLNDDKQPVVFVSFEDATKFTAWLTERERDAKRLPAGYVYRLPSKDEWTAFAQCGDVREYPWGSTMPPKFGNYSDKASAAEQKMKSYDDGFALTCPVDKSGKNDWGLYGVGGNVWECTRKSSTNPAFDAWRGGSWTISQPGIMRSDFRRTSSTPDKDENYGFRIVLGK
ncbi:MAG: SUMF1/EgtB/PvdO family nonheme iron enzyme [Lentisphaerota bacterium]